jgi:hypothetical protein
VSGPARPVCLRAAAALLGRAGRHAEAIRRFEDVHGPGPRPIEDAAFLALSRHRLGHDAGAGSIRVSLPTNAPDRGPGATRDRAGRLGCLIASPAASLADVLHQQAGQTELTAG